MSVKEIERLVSEGATVFLIRDQIFFRVIFLPKEFRDSKDVSPQEVCQNGLMLDQMLGAENFWRKHFPGIELQHLSLMHFN